MIVSSETDDYSAHFTFDNASPSPGDVMGLIFNDNKFSTYDRDNDDSATNNCAAKCGAGFWYGPWIPEVANINQSPLSLCAGFMWKLPDPGIYLKETRLYLLC